MSVQPPADTTFGAPKAGRHSELFPPTGRIGRLEFALTLLFFVVWGNGGTLAMMQSKSAESRFPVYVGLIFWGVAIACVLALSIKRLHDLDKSGWLVLLAMVPVVNLGLLLMLLLKGSAPGPNRYGVSRSRSIGKANHERSND